MKKSIFKISAAILLLNLCSVALACDTFDPGPDSSSCLASCVSAGCDTKMAGCSTYCDMQTYSPE